MSFFLAVDAGGTKTEFVLADESRELARLRTGTIKRMRTDDATATRNLDLGLAELTARASVSMQSITATCVGAAGSNVPLVANWMRSAFAARVSGSLTLVGDVDIALDAAFHGSPGVVVIAGTGSNVAGRSPEGSVITVGGWGPALSDQASGHRVGLQALRALFLAIDQEKPTSLLQPVLDRWQLQDIPSLVELANRLPAPDFSELSPVVVACARGGDTVAISILEAEAEEMANLVQIIVSRLRRLTSDPAWLPEVAFSGSMLEHVPLLRGLLVEALHRHLPGLGTREGVVDPLLGALWKARQAAP